MALQLRGLCPLLAVYDMPASIRFYRDRLGFQIVQSSPALGPDKFHWAWLRSGDAEVMLNDIYELDEQRPAVPEAARVAAHGDTILFIGCPDVDGAYAEPKAKGVEVKPPKVAPYGMKQMNLRDPDGYGICFQWPTEKR